METSRDESFESRSHVLIVDDNRLDLRYMARLLREHGYAPHVADDPQRALAFLGSAVPDLILLDVQLPTVDGYELCRRIKGDSRTRDVPVIFVSAGNEPIDKVSAFAAGAVDYISKPIHEEEALARIGTHLSLRRLAEGLVDAKERAEQASMAKSRFLASMSHELRTPLNAILGYTQLLKMAGKLDPRQERGIDVIHESGEHLLRLINDILDLARVEAGKLQLAPDAVNLGSMLGFVSRVISVRAELKGLLFVCDAASDLPPSVMVDEKRLSQVLLNLLGNSVKFTSQGTVALRVNRLADEDAGFARLRFEVEDTGSGIAQGDQLTIFQPFEQAGGESQRSAGAGLGLAISRGIIQLMGSDILVDSELGHGSRFWFDLRLPLARSIEAPEVNAYQSITGYEGPRKTVLVVDDVAANRDMSTAALGLAGFRTMEAVNGQDALQKIRECSPDLVIMDVLMPVMDGLEAIRTIRRMPPFESIPVIAVSASSYERDERRALEAGADAFLPKPLDFDRLFSRIGTLLRLAWAAR